MKAFYQSFRVWLSAYKVVLTIAKTTNDSCSQCLFVMCVSCSADCFMGGGFTIYCHNINVLIISEDKSCQLQVSNEWLYELLLLKSLVKECQTTINTNVDIAYMLC